MSATLRLTHTSIGAEVRRAPYEIVLDGRRVGVVEMHRTIEVPVDPGRHVLVVRSGRSSSRPRAFEVVDGETVGFTLTGKRFLPLFLLSFVVRTLAISIRPE